MKYTKFIIKHKGLAGPQIVEFTDLGASFKYCNLTGEKVYAFNPVEHKNWESLRITSSELIDMFISGDLKPLE